ncbi:hypothetical protein [Agromyces bracchium]|uniref:Uncharacterized protein n=1 Tax=Agromyces bracchium TaxID=88376 RepID=A0A6I3ME87_9MICO|nr:hypothetical protein [Agromyces bracchium]MTH70317.1 hypothetical protein [Agromyces bracchium]
MPTVDAAPSAAATRDRSVAHSLDELIEWCAAVLRDGVGGSPAASPPMPPHLRDPLRLHGFETFDEIALSIVLAPDLDPVLGLRMSEVTGVRDSRYSTVGAIAALMGAHAERTSVTVRLSESGPLARLGLITVHAPLDAAAERGPSTLSHVVATQTLLRWAFGITQLDPRLFPAVRDDLTAPPTPADADLVNEIAGRVHARDPHLVTLRTNSTAAALGVALDAAALARRPALVVRAAFLADAASHTRLAAEALLRDAVIIVDGDATRVPPHHWDAFATVIAIGAEPVLSARSAHDVVSVDVTSATGSATGVHLVDLIRSRGLQVAPTEADRIARWQHLEYGDLDHVAGVIAARAASRGRTGVTAQDVADVIEPARDESLRPDRELDRSR